jgi:hypothetical protein
MHEHGYDYSQVDRNRGLAQARELIAFSCGTVHHRTALAHQIGTAQYFLGYQGMGIDNPLVGSKALEKNENQDVGHDQKPSHDGGSQAIAVVVADR